MAARAALSRRFDISPLGFAASPCVERLPASHSAWEALSEQLPRLNRAQRLRAAARELPVLDIPHDWDDAQCKRAYVLLGQLVHSYVNNHRVPWHKQPTARAAADTDAVAPPATASAVLPPHAAVTSAPPPETPTPKPPTRVPPALAMPFHAVCARLGLPCVLTSALDLWNWRRAPRAVDAGIPAGDPRGMRVISSMTGTAAESGFHMIPTAMQMAAAHGGLVWQVLDAPLWAARGAAALREGAGRDGAAEACLAAASLVRTLELLAVALRRFRVIFGSVRELVDVDAFYDVYRPLLGGWWPQGIVLEGVAPGEDEQDGDAGDAAGDADAGVSGGVAGRLVRCKGPSAGQSTMIVLFDLLLGVRHGATMGQFQLEVVAGYMPRAHRACVREMCARLAAAARALGVGVGPAASESSEQPGAGPAVVPPDPVLREFGMALVSAGELDWGERLVAAHARCIDAMAALRQFHLAVATRYLVRTSKGTGESDFRGMLREALDGTRETVGEAPAAAHAEQNVAEQQLAGADRKAAVSGSNTLLVIQGAGTYLAKTLGLADRIVPKPEFLARLKEHQFELRKKREPLKGSAARTFLNACFADALLRSRAAEGMDNVLCKRGYVGVSGEPLHTQLWAGFCSPMEFGGCGGARSRVLPTDSDFVLVDVGTGELKYFCAHLQGDQPATSEEVAKADAGKSGFHDLFARLLKMLVPPPARKNNVYTDAFGKDKLQRQMEETNEATRKDSITELLSDTSAFGRESMPARLGHANSTTNLFDKLDQRKRSAKTSRRSEPHLAGMGTPGMDEESSGDVPVSKSALATALDNVSAVSAASITEDGSRGSRGQRKVPLLQQFSGDIDVQSEIVQELYDVLVEEPLGEYLRNKFGDGAKDVKIVAICTQKTRDLRDEMGARFVVALDKLEFRLEKICGHSIKFKLLEGREEADFEAAAVRQAFRYADPNAKGYPEGLLDYQLGGTISWGGGSCQGVVFLSELTGFVSVAVGLKSLQKQLQYAADKNAIEGLRESDGVFYFEGDAFLSASSHLRNYLEDTFRRCGTVGNDSLYDVSEGEECMAKLTHIPSVQAAIKLYAINYIDMEHFHIAEVEFNTMLDWIEPQLIGVKMPTAPAEADKLLENVWRPHLSIANAKGKLHWVDNAEEQLEVRLGEKLEHDSLIRKGHLKITQRFQATLRLELNSDELNNYPFDSHDIVIKLKLRSITDQLSNAFKQKLLTRRRGKGHARIFAQLKPSPGTRLGGLRKEAFPRMASEVQRSLSEWQLPFDRLRQKFSDSAREQESELWAGIRIRRKLAPLTIVHMFIRPMMVSFVGLAQFLVPIGHPEDDGLHWTNHDKLGNGEYGPKDAMGDKYLMDSTVPFRDRANLIFTLLLVFCTAGEVGLPKIFDTVDQYSTACLILLFVSTVLSMLVARTMTCKPSKSFKTAILRNGNDLQTLLELLFSSGDNWKVHYNALPEDHEEDTLETSMSELECLEAHRRYRDFNRRNWKPLRNPTKATFYWDNTSPHCPLLCQSDEITGCGPDGYRRFQRLMMTKSNMAAMMRNNAFTQNTGRKRHSLMVVWNNQMPTIENNAPTKLDCRGKSWNDNAHKIRDAATAYAKITVGDANKSSIAKTRAAAAMLAANVNGRHPSRNFCHNTPRAAGGRRVSGSAPRSNGTMTCAENGTHTANTTRPDVSTASVNGPTNVEATRLPRL
eukprot:g272.t1